MLVQRRCKEKVSFVSYLAVRDSCCGVGDVMMSKWAEVMTCMRPKSYFLRPDVAFPLGLAVVRELINQKIFNAPSLYQTNREI